MFENSSTKNRKNLIFKFVIALNGSSVYNIKSKKCMLYLVWILNMLGCQLLCSFCKKNKILLVLLRMT